MVDGLAYGWILEGPTEATTEPFGYVADLWLH